VPKSLLRGPSAFRRVDGESAYVGKQLPAGVELIVDQGPQGPLDAIADLKTSSQ